MPNFTRKIKTVFFAFAYSRLHNRETAEDALQEAFLNIVKYPATFYALDARKKVSYTLLIIKNAINGILKDKNKKIDDELSDDIEDNSLSVEDIVIGNISADKLKEFINSLPEARKQAVQLKAVYGLSNTQIADILGISETAVRKRISDAYKLIKDFIEGGQER